MTIVRSAESQSFELPGVTFHTLVSRSRGGADVAMWRFVLAPGTPGQVHRLTRQEVIHMLAGQATATLAGEAREVYAGDTIVVPPHTDFALATGRQTSCEAIALLPRDGQALFQGQPPFTPPWAV